MTEGPPQDRPAERDQIKPFHAKEASTGQETADVLSAVLKHAAEREVAAKKKAAPKPTPLWMLPLGLTLSVLAGFLLVAPPSWVVINDIPAQATEDQLQNVRAAIFLYGQKIEGYRIREGRLPQTAAEAGVPEGIDYTLRAGGYVLIASVGDNRDVVFDSSVESLSDWAQRVVGNNLSADIGA